MSTDDTSDDGDLTEEAEEVTVRDALEEEANASFDEGIVDLLAWILDTETRARIYLYLRQHPESTSEEIATGTGLYPSTVRQALAELHEEGKVTRSKRESSGAGNNPYEYTAQAPADLVTSIVDGVQEELNTVLNLDHHLGCQEATDERGPVTISVEVEQEQPGADDD
ncbi:MAG: winged helix-turn-helix transcriptional regulator [Haloglomus sp.]